MIRSKRGWVFPGLTLCVALGVLLALSAGAAFGQTFGEITGIVSDPTGAAIPSAAVTLTDVSTNATRSTVTTNAGAYTFPSVPPAIYISECPSTATASVGNSGLVRRDGERGA